MSLTLSLAAAQRLMLTAQGLDRRPPTPASKEDLLATIRKMAILQIDTINVVARSSYLVLWSRLGQYHPQWLEELLAEGKLFEYWAHEACFLPIEDYPLFRHVMLSPAGRCWVYRQDWVDANRLMLDQLLLHIREKGPVRSVDFTRQTGQSGGWWEWKAEKRGLEILFTAGELMIARRHNFQRVYDLRERILPGWNDAMLPPQAEVERLLALKAVHALGITTARWVADYFRTDKRKTVALVNALAKEGALIPVKVNEWDEPGYIHPDHLALAHAANDLVMELTTFLSPFDPLVWDRARALTMFNFDYRLECYTPEEKRIYGYFTLPILRRGALIGRVDTKAHRKDGIFEVKILHLEKGVKADKDLVDDVATALIEFAHWHKTPEIIVSASKPVTLAKALSKAIKSR